MPPRDAPPARPGARRWMGSALLSSTDWSGGGGGGAAGRAAGAWGTSAAHQAAQRAALARRKERARVHFGRIDGVGDAGQAQGARLPPVLEQLPDPGDVLHKRPPARVREPVRPAADERPDKPLLVRLALVRIQHRGIPGVARTPGEM